MSGDGEEIAVTWEDQQQINQFGRLIGKLREFEADIEEKQLEVDHLDAALSDLTALSLGLDDNDDDEGASSSSAAPSEAPEFVHYWMGEIMVEMPFDEAESLCNERKERLDGEISDIRTQMDSIQKTLAQLKVTLYSKFGHDNINLEG